MTGIRSRGVAALVLVVALAACKKEGGGGSTGDTMDLPAELKPHPAKGDPSKLVMPALLASVPADTPYLMASLDSIPAGYYARLKDAFGPLFQQMLAASQKLGDDNKLLAAVLAELDGKWNQAGLESLGFSTEPRFALYGLGLWPVVARLSVKDHKAVQATIERIAQKAGESLPPMVTKDGRSYWRVDDAHGPTVVVALADNQLIAAIGASADIDAKLGLILGSDKPSPSMADGKLVKELMARHGFGGQLIGFGDTRSIATQALALAGAKPSPACTAEIDRLSGKMPRLVFGYGEMSATRTSGGTVVELAPDLIAQLRAARTEVPGLVQVLSGHGVFAFGGGLDLAQGGKLALGAAESLKQLGTACEIGPLADGADKMIRGLSKPLPEPAGRILGGAMSIDDLKFGGKGAGGMPDSVEGIALISSPDAKALFAKALELAPPLKDLGITPDGKLHDLNGAMLPVPFPVSVGVGDKVIVATAGSQRRPTAEKLIGGHGGGKAPLLVVDYDFAKLMDLEMKALGAANTDQDMMGMFSRLKNVFGRLSGTVDVTDKGLVVWGTMEMK